MRVSLGGKRPKSLIFPVFAFAAAVCGVNNVSAAPSTVMPDTPAGRLGGEVIRHINADDANHIVQWAPSLLSPAVAEEDKADFLKGLTSAVRDTGGIDFVDARTQGPPGMLVLTVKARRTGQLAVLVVAADPALPGKLAQAALFPLDDPAFYAAWPKGAASSHAEIAHLAHDALDKLAHDSDFSGCLTIVDGAETILDECRGVAERNFGAPVDRRTRFHIGSMDKMFTAVAIAQLAEAGKLPWDATLAQLVPEYPDHDAAGKITVWQLLHHTAGLGDFFVPEFFQNREKFVNPADYLGLIARQPKTPPGGDWNYSNAGYILLGRIVENVSHENYFDYIQRHVFAPAGMTDSGFDSQEDFTPNLATGYFHDGLFSTVWKANWMTLPFKGSPAGGGYSTNADLLRFAKALKGAKLVKQATLDKMFDKEVPAGPGGYAAGFGDRPSQGRHIRGHAGGAPGMNANLAIVWETNAAVAITSNEGDSQAAMMLSETVADLLAAEGAKP